MDAEVIVVGAGAIGTSTAKHLAEAGVDVMVLEKEPGPALHQSGRNSGVIHAGYQYEPGSFKARFATQGATRLKAFCQEHGVPVDQGGLLVVARDDEEEARLEATLARAKENGVEARWLDEQGVQDVEPHAAGQAGLHVPSYASFDARSYVHALTGEAIRAGTSFLYDTHVASIEQHRGRIKLDTSKGEIRARAVVNAAGLFSDRLAQELCPDMRIVPFRGYYAELVPSKRSLVKSHIYPAPDPDLPFLGVHFSQRADGRVIVGPGAMLAFGR
ncbi:MAG: FAD-dependent oxidoreductase, partial [Candidatus Thermoplasmatota archaeon]|nr:FAD-dependent oxidoreductase [Candidatus Thermoplasmatota archaeon]